MTRCKKCGKDYQTEVKNFCSNACYELDLQKRIKDTYDDTPQAKKSS